VKGVAITYGKAGVPVYRISGGTLMAVEVDVEVFGDSFLPAYTQGDNSAVVATDTMKNFILAKAGEYEGTTIEGFLALLGRGFLETYPDMTSLGLTGRELRFDHERGVLYSRSHDDHGVAELRVERDALGWPRITELRAGRVGLELLKVTGSSFTRFVRDAYTTLPERVDRPLFIHLDVHWRYDVIADAVALDPTRHVASDQVRDAIAAVFSELVSESIQHLVWEMAERLLARFPQLSEVSFAAQNRTREPAGALEDGGRVHVYSDPFPAFGTITLVRRHEENRLR
jgi:urate oxidase